MFWSFLAIILSGLLYLDASYRCSIWKQSLFQLISLTLLLIFAWQSPNRNISDYFIIIGLMTNIIGSFMLLLSSNKYIFYYVCALFFCHLSYTVSFISCIYIAIYWLLLITILVICTILITFFWSKLNELRCITCTYIGITLIMVLSAFEQYLLFRSEHSLSLLIGSILLLISAIIWLINHHQYYFNIFRTVYAAFYFVGHFLIIRSLYI